MARWWSMTQANYALRLQASLKAETEALLDSFGNDDPPQEGDEPEEPSPAPPG